MLETVKGKLITDIEASQTIQVSEVTMCVQQLLSSPSRSALACMQALNAKPLASTISNARRLLALAIQQDAGLPSAALDGSGDIGFDVRP